MRNYELTFIFSPLLEEQEVHDTLQTIASSIQDKGGILGDQQVKGKQPLQVANLKQQEGYLAVLSFTVAAEHLGEIEKAWKENSRILRFLFLQQHKKAPKTQKIPAFSRASVTERKEVVGAQTAGETLENQHGEAKPSRITEEKVDLKNIDEKLEEIFKEA